MIFADVLRRGAFRKLAKWLFGGLVVVLRAGRGQLGCQLGFKMAWKGQVEPKMAKVGPKMGPRGLQKLFCVDYLLRVVWFWAHLGPILGYLGPSLALPGGAKGAS